MRNSTKVLALSTLSIALLLDGCSTVTGGSGSPSGSSANTPSDSSQDLHGAPKVQNPLDTSKYQADMCSVLTPQQRAALNLVSTGKADQGFSGPGCSWNESTGQHMQLRVEAATLYPYGLSTLYKKHDSGQMAVFQPLGDIDGYPAVRAELVDSTDTGSCTVSVGVTDKLAFSIGQGSNDKSDPCGTSKKIAAMVVQTLKGGS